MKRLVKFSIATFVAATMFCVLGSESLAAASPSTSDAAAKTGLLCPAPPVALHPVVSDLQLAQASGKHSQGADMRDEGYNSQYIFGMTKGIAESTLNPGLKPLLFLFTVPLDIVTLPFSAIAGFF